MIQGHRIQELESEIATGQPLQRIVSTLREFRQQGIGREEVEQMLQDLRDRTEDESIEDRILEVLDIVTGFCPQEQSIWD